MSQTYSSSKNKFSNQIAEQQEIVRRVEAKFDVCDQMEAQINITAQTAEVLSATILQEFFDQNGGER